MPSAHLSAQMVPSSQTSGLDLPSIHWFPSFLPPTRPGLLFPAHPSSSCAPGPRPQGSCEASPSWAASLMGGRRAQRGLCLEPRGDCHATWPPQRPPYEISRQGRQDCLIRQHKPKLVVLAYSLQNKITNREIPTNCFLESGSHGNRVRHPISMVTRVVRLLAVKPDKPTNDLLT